MAGVVDGRLRVGVWGGVAVLLLLPVVLAFLAVWVELAVGIFGPG